MGRVPWKCWSPGEKEQGYVTLVALVDRLPVAHHTNKRSRGRPHVSSDRLFLKALVIMIIRHLHTVHELLSVLTQPTVEMRELRELLNVLGAVFVYQLGLLYRFQPGLDLCFGLKAFLKAA
jgi:hypothetical protein